VVKAFAASAHIAVSKQVDQNHHRKNHFHGNGIPVKEIACHRNYAEKEVGGFDQNSEPECPALPEPERQREQGDTSPSVLIAVGCAFASYVGGEGTPGHLLQPRVIRGPVITGDLPVLNHKHMDTATGHPQRRTASVLIDQHDVRSQAAHVFYHPLIARKLRP
jgi:hypothetical protein